MLTLGLHTSDIRAITDSCVMDLPDYIDRDGMRRPKIIIGPFRKTKQHWKSVRNTIGCGCRHSHNSSDESSVVVFPFHVDNNSDGPPTSSVVFRHLGIKKSNAFVKKM
jgi:hypothetical protein